jgi:cytoskeleton protein RodZ
MMGPIGQVFEPENTDARVVLRAIESSWLRISSANGEYVRDHTLEPNDVLLVPKRPDLALWTGNAGGLQVIVDGIILAPLGTSGAVIHGVSLEPSNLRTRLGPPPTR